MEITGLDSLKACFYFSLVPFGREWGVKGEMWGGSEAEMAVLVIFNQTHSF